MKRNWYVITGAPSSGKTKTIEYLAFLGYQTMPESARILIDTEMAKGKSLRQVRQNEHDFQSKVFELKIQAENRLQKNEVIFFDRGLPDSIAFYKLHDLNLDEIIPRCHKKYKKIFLLEPLVYQIDYGRNETQEEAIQLHKNLGEAYKLVGYNVIKVPKDTIENRSNYIIARL